MMTAADGGRGLHFSLFGFPVRVDVTFLLIAAFLGLGNGDLDVALMATWVVVLGGSILAHELGHAFAARSLGARPHIVLHGMGGLTSYAPPRPPTRLEAIGVSLAGPAAGFGLGVVVLVAALLAPTPADGSLGELALRATIYINLAWGFVNLLPVLPLDGGHILVELMPGDAVERHRRAAIVSMVTAAIGAVAVWAAGLPFAAVLFAVFGATNFASVRGHRDRRRFEDEDTELGSALMAMAAGDPAAVDRLSTLVRSTERADLRDGVKYTLVEYLAVTRNPRARHELDTLPGRVDPAVYALVSLAEAGPGADISELVEAFQHGPSPLGARSLVMGAALVGRTDRVIDAFVEGPPAARTLPVLAFAQAAAHQREVFDTAIDVGRLLLQVPAEAGPEHRYDLACSLARAGRADGALAMLADAVDHGWGDREMLDGDPDLASVRLLVGFAEVRTRVG